MLFILSHFCNWKCFIHPNKTGDKKKPLQVNCPPPGPHYPPLLPTPPAASLSCFSVSLLKFLRCISVFFLNLRFHWFEETSHVKQETHVDICRSSFQPAEGAVGFNMPPKRRPECLWPWVTHLMKGSEMLKDIFFLITKKPQKRLENMTFRRKY